MASPTPDPINSPVLYASFPIPIMVSNANSPVPCTRPKVLFPIHSNDSFKKYPSGSI